MSDTTLQRIYDLKAQGVDALISDINKVVNRLDYLGKVKKSIFEGANAFGAPEAFAQMTVEIQKQVDLQMQLLNSYKAVNAEKSNGAKIVESSAKGLPLKEMAPDKDYAAKIRAMNVAADVNRMYPGQRKQFLEEMTAASRQLEQEEAARQKQMQLGEKLAADVEKANIKAAKSSIDAINEEIAAEEQLLAKQMADGEKRAAAMDAEAAKQQEKEAKAQAAYEKTLTALARLKAQYKEAADLAQELGAQQVLLQQQIDSSNKGGTPLSEDELKQKRAELDALMPRLSEAQQKAHGLSTALHGIELATGQGQRNVGQYNEAVRGLKDILRDTPAFAYSMATGIMAISNNIPMFLDGMKKMREENAALIAEGKETKSILSQLAGAVTDFGTVATIGVTILIALISHIGNATDEEKAMREATDALRSAFSSMGDEMEKIIALDQKLIEAETKAKYGIDLTTESYREKEKAIKAVGATNGEVYAAEKSLFDAQQQTRAMELNDLNEKLRLYTQIKSIVGDLNDNTGKGMSGIWGDIKGIFTNGNVDAGEQADIAKGIINKSVLPGDIKASLNDAINKAVKDDANILDALERQFKEYSGKLIDSQVEVSKKQNEINNAKVEFDTKYRLMAEAKHKELNNALVQSDEELRQLTEKEYFDSVDKITENVQAKYEIMYNNLRQERDKYLKENPGDEASLAKYNTLLANVLKQAEIDRQNQVNAFIDQQARAGRGYAVSESQSAAQQAALNARGGVPLYSNFLKASDADVQAKKDAETKAFDDLYEAYVKNGQSTEVLTQQHEERMRQIEREGYAQRLSIANTFFKTLSEETDKVTAIFTEQIDTDLLRQLTAITSGGGSREQKDHAKEIAQAQGTIAKAQEALRGLDIKISQAKEAEAKDVAAVNSATTPEQKKVAGENLLAIQKEITDLTNQQAKAENDIANATEQLTARKQAEWEQIRQTLTNGAVDIAQAAAEAEMQVLSAQDAARDRSAQKQMAWNQKLLQSQAQSKQQQLANEKAFMVQQEQMEKEKALRAQQRAKQQMLIEYAAAALKIVAANIWKGPEGWGEVAAEEAILAATYAAKLALLSSAPAYATGTEGHKGGVAIVGDGGEPELVQAGNRYYVTPSTATPVFMEAGAKVTPFSKIPDIAQVGGLSYPGTMGAQLKAPSYYANGTGGGWQGDTKQFDAIAAAFGNIHNTMLTVMEGIANMNVSLDTNKLTSKINYNTTKKVQI